MNGVMCSTRDRHLYERARAQFTEVSPSWAALTADGGREIECGWLKDRFGMAWQIVPTRMMEILRAGEPEGRKRAFAAMMTMTKLDLAAIERAYAGGS